MKKRLAAKRRVAIILVAFSLLVIGGVVTFVLWPRSSPVSPEVKKESQVVTTDYRPMTFQTQDELARYLQTLKTISGLKDENIHAIPTTDWNSQGVLAVPFNIPAAESYRSIAIETIEGKMSVVIDVLGEAQGCSSVQINIDHVAFVTIDQSELDDIFAVVKRITPNSARCDF